MTDRPDGVAIVVTVLLVLAGAVGLTAGLTLALRGSRASDALRARMHAAGASAIASTGDARLRRVS